MRKLSDQFNIHFEGHLRVREYREIDHLGQHEKRRLIMRRRNAIHPEHASIVIARGLADRADGRIYRMWFGTGGATIDPLGNIVYATPNTSGAADLNNPVFFKIVDDNKGAAPGNQMAVRHINGTLFSDVEIRCVLDKNEPFGQPAFDNVGNININRSQFEFDEIGLKTQDGLLVTHVTFSPIAKSANRIIEVVYVLRVSLVQ